MLVQMLPKFDRAQLREHLLTLLNIELRFVFNPLFRQNVQFLRDYWLSWVDSHVLGYIVINPHGFMIIKGGLVTFLFPFGHW